MGRKCLVSLMAKMMLGMRKKVQHPKLNQKAFYEERARGSPLSCLGRGSPQALEGFGEPCGSWCWCVWGVSELLLALAALSSCWLVVGCCTTQVPAKPPQRDGDRILTQGSAMRSHRITRPLSRAVASG